MSKRVKAPSPSTVPTPTLSSSDVRAPPFTIADLPESEKARITALAERLMSLGREHEETMSHLSNERARHATEIDQANRRLEEELGIVDSKLMAQSESICTLQEHRSSAFSLLKQYQLRLESFAEEMRGSKRREEEAANRARLSEEHVAQLERIIENQRLSAQGLEAANETTKQALKESLEVAEERHRRGTEESMALRESMKKTEQRCKGLENAIAGFTKQIANMKAAAGLKDERISDLQKALETSQNTNATLKLTTRAAEEAATAVNIQVVQLQTQVTQLQAAQAAAAKIGRSKSVRRRRSRSEARVLRNSHDADAAAASSPSRALSDDHDLPTDGTRSSTEDLGRSLHSASSLSPSVNGRDGSRRLTVAKKRLHETDKTREVMSVRRQGSTEVPTTVLVRDGRRMGQLPTASSSSSLTPAAAAQKQTSVAYAQSASSSPGYAAPTRVRPSDKASQRLGAAKPSTKPSLAVELGEHRQYDASLLFVLESI